MNGKFINKNQIIRKNMIRVSLFSFFCLLLFFCFKVNAGTFDNVFGWAWSPSTGWVSFNCVGDPNFICTTASYGVNVDITSGHFSGYAWSSNLGWLSFEEDDAPNYDFSDDCVETCSASNNCTACYNYNTGEVYGWAKFLILGDDGWTKFDHGQSDPVTIGSTTGDFLGYSWGGSIAGSDYPGTGWLSFNCENNNICDTSMYKVVGNFVNHAPEVRNMTAPNWNFEDACGAGAARQTFLKWDYYDRDIASCEKSYQIIVDDDNNPDDPLLDTGECQGSYSLGECSGGSVAQGQNSKCVSTVNANNFNLRMAFEDDGDANTNLEYGKQYYWWIKVWDERGMSSEWQQYNTIPDTDNDDSSEYTFTTYIHDFPDVNFAKFPASPAIGENVTFNPFATSTETVIYRIEDNALLCTSDIVCNDVEWDWQFEQAIPQSSSSSTPTVKFYQGGTMDVTLTVTHVDGSNYSCSATKPLENISVCLPLWQESNP